MELAKTLRLRAAIFGHSPRIKRTAKVCIGLIAAAYLLQSYLIRELLFAEAAVAVGFVVVALIGAVCALAYIAVLWLRRLGSRLIALGALVRVRLWQPFANTTTLGLSKAKEEVS